jgi:leucyl aminopeptidase
MRLTVQAGNPLEWSTPALVMGCGTEPAGDPLFDAVNAALGGLPASMYETKEFTGKPGTIQVVHTLGALPAQLVVLAGVGDIKEVTPERVRQSAGAAAQALLAARASSAATVLHEVAPVTGLLEASLEGFSLGAYRYDCYKTKDRQPVALEEMTALLSEADSISQSAADEVRTVCDAVSMARDLVSAPGNVATPFHLAEKALELGGQYGIHCTILHQEELEKLGMGALLAVGQGSQHPPRMVVMEYRGAGTTEKPTALVGKGITFDTGGISLKPGANMEMMKQDMAGGAAVLGTMQAAAALKLPVNLVALVPLAENMPDGRAYKPGDVVTTLSGQTVEINNTDAEGRLILCDALHYAHRFTPAAIIDLATLTGACVVALGHNATGAMGNDPKLLSALSRAGEATGERLWELPLWDEYGDLMKSDIADLKNAGGPHAGTISAGWFLKQFVGTYKWVHLDIAGTAWEDKGRHYLPKGATGVGVRLLVEYLKGIAP